ncbi:aspartate ammonia-lyase [Melioribacteraceae bacterium 4301-Me]|uniref:aspartate ammonia-lyase n=1 Tax=Pyranulibacter aquaticus TaxID=3163344 RepID=UPI0035987E46
MRIEKDSIGELEIPQDAAYGIHTVRSVQNFFQSGEKINPYLIKAYFQVKLAAAQTNYKCGLLFKEKFDAIEEAIISLIRESDEAILGKSDSIYNKIIVDPYQGGAGTSLNMNVNEVIANEALKILGKNYGDYKIISPLDDVNLGQSTNDTFPTAVKVASIYLIRELAESFASLQNSLQKKEVEFKNILKLGRTQMQDAVPITLGQEFGAYAQAIARDRWRLYNAEERLRSVNLGGTAVGTSVAANKEYVLNVNNILKKITNLPIAKSEDLIDATQNLDVFVEVHGIVKAGASSINKICNDLRFLSSGPNGGIGEINLPSKQAGSSIMPGKVNPVILENTIQICELIKGHDVIITNAVANGNLELNPFLPLISHLFLKSIHLLKKSNYNLTKNCIDGITANLEKCKSHLISSSAIAASLIPTYGYETIQEIVKYAHQNKISFVSALMKTKLITEKELLNLISKEMGVDSE